MKLVPRLTLWFMLSMAALLSARGVLRVRHQAAAFDNDMQRDHRVIGRALAADLADVWRSDGASRAERLVEIAGSTAGPGIKLAWLAGSTPADAAVPVADRTRALAGQEVQHLDEDSLLSLFPVRAGSTVGVLLVSESLAERDRYVHSSIVHASISLAFVMACCGALALGLSRWLVAVPVRLLIDKAQRVAHGDFSTPLNLPRDDEFRSLAFEMNAMCDALERAKAEVAAQGQARHLAIEQLRHAERLSTVGKLAAGVAHELGTPLSIVSGHAEMIANGEVLGPKVLESATIIDREAQRIARIVRSLLGFARRKGPEGNSCDVSEGAERCIALFQPMAERAGVRLTIEAMPDCRATIDQDSLEQVMANLLSNAIQATSAGGTIRIRVALESATPPREAGTVARDFVRLDVLDSGSGISAQVMPHIFEPFFSTKAPGEGTGLGLSVVYGIVEDHHGWIAVDSRAGRGAEFCVFLPRASAS